MRIAVLLLFGVLLFGLFGCDGGGTPSQENATNGTNQTEKPPVTIIVDEQKNQTTESNVTIEQPPPPPPEVKELEYEYTPDALFGVYFIDVGGPALHGDAILIKKGDCDILIDAGSAQKGPKVVDFLKSRGVDDIEVLISTTADPRRYGGISAVSEKYRVEEFWWGGSDFEDFDYAAVANGMEGKVKTVRTVQDGFASDVNGIRFTALNPSVSDRFDDLNNDAVVLRMDDRNFSILFTSNIQTGAQGRLVNQKAGEIQAELIQAPNYGVGTGTSNIGIFLLTAKPKAMIVTGSSDESAPNGGSREPFERLMAQYGISWYESFTNGTIRISGDGQAYTVQSLGAGQ